MKTDCFDIGTIQAFLDGELAHDEVTRVSGHIAACDACALMLADAEDESAVVFPALEREFNTLVPTQRLWNKINDSIATERDNLPFWHKAWAFLTVSLLNPSIAVAASILLVVGIFAAVWMNRTSSPSLVAENTRRTEKVSVPAAIDPVVQPVSAEQPAKTIQAAYRPETRRISMTPAVYRTTANANDNGYMPGEESYVRTISSLSKSVDDQKDDVLRPSERIAYERDMAVVNDAIAKMKSEVKKNPKNESAKQVLYSSYQNKIDLLNSVSQKEELMASLK